MASERQRTPVRPSTLLLVLLALLAWQGQGLPTFSLYETVAPGPGKNILNLVTTITVPDSTTSLTTCFHVRINGLHGEMDYIFKIKSLVEIGWLEKKIVVKDGVDSFSQMLKPWSFRTWHHVCVIQGLDRRFVVDGQTVEMYVYIPIHPFRYSELTTDTLYSAVLKSGTLDVTIGTSIELFSLGIFETPSFVASPPQIFPRSLEFSEISLLQSCGKVPDDNLFVNPIVEKRYHVNRSLIYEEILSLEEPVSGVNQTYEQTDDGLSVKVASSSDFCFPTKDYFYFLIAMAPVTRQYAAELCRSHKGTLPYIDDPHLVPHMTDVLFEESGVVAFWFGDIINKTHGKVFSMDSTKISQYFEMSLKRTSGLQIVCKIKVGTFLHVFTDNIDKNLEIIYPGRCKSGPIGCYYTNDMSVISMEDDGKSFSFSESSGAWKYTISTMKKSIPIGRNKWFLNSINETVDLVITPCNVNEFTCDDASCIPLEKHCDGSPNCADFSDESCNFTLPLSDSYDNKRPYDQHIPLNITVTIDRIPLVDVDHGIIQLLLKIETIWIDERIKFIQLQDDWANNPIYENVWAPKYNLERVLFSDVLEYNKNTNSIKELFASKLNTSGTINHRSREKRQYKGQLVRQETVSLTFDCYFELNLFPFGYHPCEFTLSIADKGDMAPVFEENGVSVLMPPQLLSKFESNYVNFKLDEKNSNKTIRVAILLDSRFGGYILSTFLPCNIIGLIGSMTLLFAFDNFQDRIMVTLSCLIVEAGLYSQINSNMPASASPKAVDIFFFYNIARLFWVCLHHTINYRWLAYSKNKKTTGGSVAPATPVSKTEESPIRILIVPEAPTYYAPNEKKIGMSTWTTNAYNERYSEHDMRTLKKYNIFITVVYMFADLGFVCVFMFYIVSLRNNIWVEFNTE